MLARRFSSFISSIAPNSVQEQPSIQVPIQVPAQAHTQSAQPISITVIVNTKPNLTEENQPDEKFYSIEKKILNLLSSKNYFYPILVTSAFYFLNPLNCFYPWRTIIYFSAGTIISTILTYLPETNPYSLKNLTENNIKILSLALTIINLLTSLKIFNLGLLAGYFINKNIQKITRQ